MKKILYFLTYFAAAIIGLLLLVFNQQALYDVEAPAIRGLIIAMGIIFVIPGVVLLFSSMKPKVNKEGVLVTKPWYLTAMAIASLVWGISLLAMSAKFAEILAVTVGVSLILAGLASVIWIRQSAGRLGAAGWWYVVPFCVFCGGIVCITLINDYAATMQSSSTAAIVGGILLICFGVNGIGCVNRKSRIKEDEKRESDVSEPSSENMSESK